MPPSGPLDLHPISYEDRLILVPLRFGHHLQFDFIDGARAILTKAVALVSIGQLLRFLSLVATLFSAAHLLEELLFLRRLGLSHQNFSVSEESNLVGEVKLSAVLQIGLYVVIGKLR